MEIKLSRHARRQMKWRKIVAEEVSAVISDPDKVEDSKKGRKNAFKIVHGRLLKVTYKQEGETAVVITAMVKGEKQDENRI
jgi:hypothetical protein